MKIFKVLGADEWAQAERAGVFHGSAVDVRDGYIHFSTAEQAPTTVNLYFPDRDDLVALAVEADGLGEALKWEPSRGGALFPHLYAALPLANVVWARAFSSRASGALQALLAAE